MISFLRRLKSEIAWSTSVTDFELVFRDLIAELPLEAEYDRGIYRLLLLTLLNNVSNWYRPGRMNPSDIGRQIATIFRHRGRN